MELDGGEAFEIHAKVARQEAQRQEETRHNGQLLHRFVLIRRNRVEDQIDQVVGRPPHLVVRVLDQERVILHIAQIR